MKTAVDVVRHGMELVIVQQLFENLSGRFFLRLLQIIAFSHSGNIDSINRQSTLTPLLSV